uniref:Uncharacterized protein n=1 Tax=Rhizophora mucronata TaxID=61149 RepID=A0A2P2K7P8_RHIMU
MKRHLTSWTAISNCPQNLSFFLLLFF